MVSKWLQTRTCIHLSAFTITLLFAIYISSRKSSEMEPKSAFLSFARVLHLFCFATWLGVQFWVSFVGGITMYYTVTRHVFGQLQKQLFPKYFALGVIFSTISLATFLMFHPIGTLTSTQRWQCIGLAVSLAASLANLFYVEPLTTGVMIERHAIETEHGLGTEVGHTVHRKLMAENKRYAYLTNLFIKCRPSSIYKYLLVRWLCDTSMVFGVPISNVVSWFLDSLSWSMMDCTFVRNGSNRLPNES